MIKTIYILILLSLILSSCKSIQEFPTTIYVDSRFTNTEKEIIKSALQEWHIASKGLTDYELIFNYKVDCSIDGVEEKEEDKKVIFRCNSTDEFILDRNIKTNKTKYLGLGSLDHILLVMDRFKNSYEEMMFNIMIHELGHFYALNHSNNKTSIMYPYVPKINCIDQETIDRFCGLYLCEGNETCEDNIVPDFIEEECVELPDETL